MRSTMDSLFRQEESLSKVNLLRKTYGKGLARDERHLLKTLNINFVNVNILQVEEQRCPGSKISANVAMIKRIIGI